MDGEFEKFKNELPLVVCNTTAAKEHVSEAERSICTIKERMRGIVGTLPFEFILRRLKMGFIYCVVLWLNAFPAKSGISSTSSPRELLVRWKLDYKKHCRVLPGTYCETHDESVPTNTMTPRTHKCIACRPTGNIQGSIIFYCLTMGRILKRRSFTAMPMPDRIIKHVNSIGSWEKQGCTFQFTDRSKEPYEWTDSVPEDDPDFQGLLEDDEAPFPDISAELPGVPLEEEEYDFQVVTDKPEPDLGDLAAAALDNAGIDTSKWLHAARVAADAVAALPIRDQQDGPRLIAAEPNKMVYEIIVDLPDAGLLPGLVPDNESIAPPPDNDPIPAPSTRRYPTRSCRSVVGNQPYDTYAPRMQFLQLGEVRVHRSALSAAQERREQRELPHNKELMHATTSSNLDVDDTVHQVDPEFHTTSEDEMAVWGCLMTQYNLEPGPRKFGTRGETAAISELTQLHVMDTWTVMDLTKLTREDKMKALSSLLFLKENDVERSRAELARMEHYRGRIFLRKMQHHRLSSLN